MSVAFCLIGCSELLGPNIPEGKEVPVQVTFSLTDKTVRTKSKVSGTEKLVHTMQLVCFDANGQYLGIRNATVSSKGASGTFFDKGLINGTVPQGTARIHFIANRNLDVPLSHSNGTTESVVMNSPELSTLWNDAAHQEICYWGYHQEDNADAMSRWLKPEEESDDYIVYMIRDRAKVVLTYDPKEAEYPVTKIEWLIHNGRERGYLAPAEANWSNNGYYRNSTKDGHTSELISTAGIHEYQTSGRYSLWTSETENDENNFDVAYQNSGTYTPAPQYLFDDDNTDNDDIKVILRVTYQVNESATRVYHVLRLNDDDKVKYDVVRNNTYYIECKKLSPYISFYGTLKDAIEGTEFVNSDVEVDRAVPDINNKTHTLQIKLPNEGSTSIVLNTAGPHEMDFVFRAISDLSTSASVDPDDFDVYWEKSQSFCASNLQVTYNSSTQQFTITANVLQDNLSDQLQDEWIVVKHKSSGLTRYIHVYAIEKFQYTTPPSLKKVDNVYELSFQLPPVKHTRFLPDGTTPDLTEMVYPEGLYPIEIKFATNTLNAYGIVQDTNNYGLFGVSVESTEKLLNSREFESDFNTPISTTNTDFITQWYFQQNNNYWDFWYTYSLESYPTDGWVKIYFKDVRSNIQYATVQNVGLFLNVNYFGKIYSIPVSTN